MFAFLRSLTMNNTRDWFTDHKADYGRYYVEPAGAFVETMSPRLQQFAPGAKYEARAGGSLLRIYRDLRFPQDETPYKTDLDMWFLQGERKRYHAAGFFFRLASDQLILGAGMHHFPKERSEAYRRAVTDPAQSTSLFGSLADLQGAV